MDIDGNTILVDNETDYIKARKLDDGSLAIRYDSKKDLIGLAFNLPASAFKALRELMVPAQKTGQHVFVVDGIKVKVRKSRLGGLYFHGLTGDSGFGFRLDDQALSVIREMAEPESVGLDEQDTDFLTDISAQVPKEHAAEKEAIADLDQHHLGPGTMNALMRYLDARDARMIFDASEKNSQEFRKLMAEIEP